jgi:hypothetical protein
MWHFEQTTTHPTFIHPTHGKQQHHARKQINTLQI